MLNRGMIMAGLSALVLSGCAGDRVTGTGANENTGTLLGAVGGALVGSQIGGGTGERVAAAVAGAAIGGLIGNRIGAALDDEDRRYAYEAQMQALDNGSPGAPVGWRNADSGRYGTIVPGPYYDSRGQRCRSYTTRTAPGSRSPDFPAAAHAGKVC
jgi:surface antigen